MDMFFLLNIFWHGQIMKNHVFCYNFSCMKKFAIYYIFLLDIQCATFCIENRVSKEQIVILPFFPNLLLLT